MSQMLDLYGIEVVHLKHVAGVSRYGRPFELRRESIERARQAAMPHSVNEDHGFVTFEQSIGQIDATDAEIDHAHVFAPRSLREALGDLDAESVVAQKDIADAGN